MKRWFISMIAAICLALIAGCENSSLPSPTFARGTGAVQDTVTIFAAASATNAVDEIKAAFAEKTGVEVRASYAASSTLARQIENGAKADLFLSADQKWADYLAEKRPIARRQTLLGNRLVIVVPLDSSLELATAEDLLSGDVRHLALGDPDAVPAGRYAKQALMNLGLWEAVKAKVASAEDVRHALGYVETGAAEAGIVYATDAAVSQKVRVAVEIPIDLTEPVRYPLLLMERGAKCPAAEAFYDYLASPKAAAIFEKYGFSGP